MIVSAILKAISFYVLYRVIKSLLSKADSSKRAPYSYTKDSQGPGQRANKNSDVIDAEYKVIK